MAMRPIKKADIRQKQYLKSLLARDPRDCGFCVLGAGHGGLAMAGHLGLKGCRVNLYNRSIEKTRPVKRRKGIKVEGEVKGIGKIELASNKIEECLEDVEVLMVVVPATAHRFIARICAPHLKEYHIVILNPGRTGGALEFMHTLREEGLKHFPFIAEAQTFIYASRALGPAHAKIFSVKNSAIS